MSLPSGLPVHVADEEVIARHVFTDRHITSDGKDSSKKWAKPQAFLPQPTDEGWVFSVSRTMKLSNDEAIQRNGIEIGAVGNRGYKGSALLAAKQIRETSMKDDKGDSLHPLDVESHEKADGSTPYHAHVTGFLPLPAGASIKEYFKEASEDLARKARDRAFVMRTLPEE